MDTIADFISQKDRIAELERQNLSLYKFASKCKRKCEELSLANKLTRESRSRDAEVFVKAWIGGDTSLSLKDIAAKFFLGYGTVRNISSRLRANEKLQTNC